MLLLMADAARAGRRPMLHVKTENGAKHLYAKLGFRVRRAVRLTISGRDDLGASGDPFVDLRG